MYTYMNIYMLGIVTALCRSCYGVATISRMLKNIGLFCKRYLQKRPIFCKETYIFKHPTNRSHPISVSIVVAEIEEGSVCEHETDYKRARAPRERACASAYSRKRKTKKKMSNYPFLVTSSTHLRMLSL